MSNATDVLDKALDTLTREIDKLFVKSQGEDPLDRSDASSLTDYIKTLIIVRKDDRDAAKADPMSTKSDEELFDLAKQAIEYLNQTEEKEKKDAEPTDSVNQAPSTETK